MAMAPDWNDGRDLLTLLERFTGSKQWDDPTKLTEAYERHNAEVRRDVPRHRLLDWRAEKGWEPLCHALHVPVPDAPFPWVNRRSDWK